MGHKTDLEEYLENRDKTFEDKESKKVIDPRNIIIFALVIVIIAAIVVLVMLMNSNKKNESTEVSTEQSIYTGKRSGEFDIDYEKQVTKLADYSNVPVTLSTEYEITDEAKQLYFERVLDTFGINKYKEETDRDTVEAGDIADIDYTGYKDGVAFDGGSAQGVMLDVSNNTDTTGMPYIEGFSDPIIGMSVGETKSSEITFPEDYGNEELAGATVTFEFTVNSIYSTDTLTVADMTDEKVNEYFGASTGVTTVDSLVEQIEKDLNQQKYSATVEEVKTYMIENSEVDIPEDYFEARFYEYEQSFINENVPEGETLESFIQSNLGITVEQLEENWRSTLENQIKAEFVFGLIAQKEDIQMEDDVFNDYMDYIISASSGTLADKDAVYEYFGSGNKEEGQKYLESQFLVNKAIDFVSEKAVVSFAEETQY